MSQGDSLPAVNKGVVSFVREHVGERVGRGECWDLAAAALNAAKAEWDRNYGFGRVVDHGKEAVLPGDIVQFEGAEFRWEEGSAVHTARMPRHTAVVLEVIAPGVYTIGEQNTREHGRRVGLGDLVLTRQIGGTIGFFRPIGD